MQNFIIIAILVVVLAVSILKAKKHFQGGGCCSSGSNTIRVKKTLTAPKIGEKTMTVQGMHCENCEARVENALNRLDGVVAKADWKKNTVSVSYSAEVSDELLKDTVQRLDYQVIEIR